MEETHILEWGDKIYKFKHKPFDAEVDMDDLTMIHYDNLIGEIITIPTLMNKIGILKAEADNAVREVKLSHKILEAEKSQEFRKSLVISDGSKVKYPTVGQLEDAVMLDLSVRESKGNYYRVLKQSEIIDSLYWATKSKEMKLNQISQGITPREFQSEILEGTINGILIKALEKKF